MENAGKDEAFRVLLPFYQKTFLSSSFGPFPWNRTVPPLRTSVRSRKIFPGPLISGGRHGRGGMEIRKKNKGWPLVFWKTDPIQVDGMFGPSVFFSCWAAFKSFPFPLPVFPFSAFFFPIRIHPLPLVSFPFGSSCKIGPELSDSFFLCRFPSVFVNGEGRGIPMQNKLIQKREG